MRSAFGAVVLLLLASVVLGATVFREQVARAAPPIMEVFVTNETLTVREEAGEPVQEDFPFQFTGSFVSEAAYTVPAGKRLRIALVTFSDGNRPEGVQHLSVRSVAGGPSEVFHYLATSQLAGNAEAASEQVEIYADPGTTVRFRVQLTTPTGSPTSPVSMFGSFSGELIDVP